MSKNCDGHFSNLSNQTKSFFNLFSDLLKLYHHPIMDPDAGNRELQNKVIFDLRFYFCHRGNENVHGWTKSTFELKFDQESGITCLEKVIDEMTKNHKETNVEILTGFMPQMLDSTGQPHKYCLIHSFENYIGKLNNTIENLWQTPIHKVKDLTKPVWCLAEPMGHNPIKKFMGKLSTQCELSDYYTNHCIRVTNGTCLQRDGRFISKQIMSVTGHKSVQSLAVYQRVKSDEKLMMGMSLTYSLLHPQEVHETQEAMKKHLNKNQETMTKAIESPHQNAKILKPIQVNTTSPEPHALDQSVPKIVSLDPGLVPYQPNNENQPTTTSDSSFDLMSILSEFDSPDDNQLIMAASQIENQCANSTKNTTLVKKNQQQNPFQKHLHKLFVWHLQNPEHKHLQELN